MKSIKTQARTVVPAVTGAVLALGVFIFAERRAEEPILPLKLFTINNFLVANGVGFIVGTAMYSTLTFVPFFMQVVKGVSPAASGMFIFPMMLGLIFASTVAGRTMSRTGRYRMLPVGSTLLLAVAMMLLALMTPETPDALIVIYMVMAGLGIGPVMGVGVTAIQNAVPVSMIGIGTASANMFRLIGGTIGTSAYGALFSAGLASRLGGLAVAGNPRALTSTQIAAMEPGLRDMVVNGIAGALHPLFWCSAALACLASCVALLMHEYPLRDTLVPVSRPANAPAE